MDNPLLQPQDFPPFNELQPAHVEPAVRSLLAHGREQISRLLGAEHYNWDNLVAPLEQIDDRLDQAWSPVSHLNAVCNEPALREAYNACLPLLSDYATELGQNRELFEAMRYIAAQQQDLDDAQRMLLHQAIRDFELSGVGLPEQDKQRYGELSRRLSELCSRFSDNVLDASNAWTLHIEDESRLAGIPEISRGSMRAAAEQKSRAGWLLTLEYPDYAAVMMHAEDRELRRAMYQAWATRASDCGPQAGEFDNSELITEVLSARHEKARLLGFASYAEYSLATKMARTPDEVVNFLLDLAQRAREPAIAEYRELQQFAADSLALPDLQPWDISWASEKLREARYQVSEEALRPYFPLPRVLEGMFAIVGRLFGIAVVEEHEFPKYHDSLRRFRIEQNGAALAWFYLDACAREHKRGGAWMDEYRSRRVINSGATQLPVAYLVCNFPQETAGRPSLLSHDEVTTLFHEFGHGLHHMLTRVNYKGVSGINGVPWDAVELPSQFLENWCWEREVIPLISGHYQTGEPLPADELDRLLSARNFQAAMQMLRQVEFSLFDFRLHLEYDPAQPRPILDVLADVRGLTGIFTLPEWHRFPHSFSHIFAGGYAAGYYSYKWAEVLAADAFGRFREEGVMNPDCGQAFLDSVLSQGGSREPMDLFVEFRGREPKVDALLQSCGLGDGA